MVALALLVVLVSENISAQDVNCEDEFFSVHPSPSNCFNFFVCMINRRLGFSCDADFIFDARREICVPGNQRTCVATIPELAPDVCEGEFLLVGRHPARCWQFFVCLNSNLINFECDADYIFSEEVERCVPGNRETCIETPAVPYSAPFFQKFLV